MVSTEILISKSTRDYNKSFSIFFLVFVLLYM